MPRFLQRRVPLCVGTLLFLMSGMSAGPVNVRSQASLDLATIPLAEWWQAGETTEIEWKTDVNDAELRHDQRFGLTYSVEVEGDALNTAGSRDLFLISRMRLAGGDWLHEPVIAHKAAEGVTDFPAQDAPSRSVSTPDVEFEMRAFVRPGEYELWLALYDRETGKHNVAVHEIEVKTIGDDPLPHLLDPEPRVEIMEGKKSTPVTDDRVPQLALPVTNREPVDVQIIATFNPPEQWSDRSRMRRAHSDQTIGALAVLSQLHLTQGSISITGLDLVERQVVYEQRDFRQDEHWPALLESFKESDTHAVSFAALEGRRENAAFLKQFMEDRLNSGSPTGTRTRVFIVVSSSVVFERGSDLSSAELKGDCNCRIYHIRLQVPPQVVGYEIIREDVFDELGRVLRSLDPQNFRVSEPLDLRKAIARIVKDLEAL